MQSRLERGFRIAVCIDQDAVNQIDGILRRFAAEVLKQTIEGFDSKYVIKDPLNQTEQNGDKKDRGILIPEHRWFIEHHTNKLSAPPSFSVECADGSKIEMDTVQELLSYSNRTHRRIKRLTAELSGGEPRSRCNVDIRNDSWSPTVSYKIDGDDRTVVMYSTELERMLKSFRTWYGFAARLTWLPAAAILFTLLSAYLIGADSIRGIALLIQPDLNIHINSDEVSSHLKAVLLLGPVSSMAGAGVWVAIRRFLFPNSTFAIGDGIRRKDRLYWIHKFIFVTVIAAAAVGVAVNRLS